SEAAAARAARLPSNRAALAAA
nr:hypothetical protein [Tanacetum cinerariifolium]